MDPSNWEPDKSYLGLRESPKLTGTVNLLSLEGNPLIELLNFVEWDYILDLFEMQTAGGSTSQELLIMPHRISSRLEVVVDSFESVFEQKKFIKFHTTELDSKNKSRVKDSN